MTNAPVDDDVDLRVLARAKAMGFTFRVCRVGLVVRCWKFTQVNYGVKSITKRIESDLIYDMNRIAPGMALGC